MRAVPPLVAVVLVSLALLAPAAGAADNTDLVLDPPDQTVTAGSNATYDLVVTETKDGIGRYKITVQVSDTRVARLVNATVYGEPENSDIVSGGDGERLRLDVRNLNESYRQAEDRNLTLATVTVRGASRGEAQLFLDVSELDDRNGDEYSVDERSAKLTVDRAPTPTATPTATPTRTATPNETETVTPTPNETTPTDRITAIPVDTPTAVPTDTASMETPTPTATTSTATGRPSPTVSLPGFGPVVAAVAVLLAGLLARRWD